MTSVDFSSLRVDSHRRDATIYNNRRRVSLRKSGRNVFAPLTSAKRDEAFGSHRSGLPPASLIKETHFPARLIHEADRPVYRHLADSQK